MDLKTLIICSLAFLFVKTVSGQTYGRRGPICGPVCAIFCEFGNVLDGRGCPTCNCNPEPRCPSGSSLVRPFQTCNPWRLTSLVQCGGHNTFCHGRGRSLRRGICCEREPIGHQCESNNIITPCVETFDSCQDNTDCPRDYKCCPKGCGKRCVYAFGAGYRPQRPRWPPILTA